MQSVMFMHATAGSITVPPVSLDIDLLTWSQDLR